MNHCTQDGCQKKVQSRGLCAMHYQRGRLGGTMIIGHKNWRDDSIRFWKYVSKSDGCWNWVGTRHRQGYGMFHRNGKNIVAHRYSYELLKGEIPEGLVLDHLCRNTSCVNPDHLEAVTQRINSLRGLGASGINARKTHCDYGHSLPENRKCMICRKNQQAKDIKKRSEARQRARELKETICSIN